MGKYRSRLEIVADILSAIKRGAQKKTHVMYRANLSYKLLSIYINEVLNAGLINVKNGDCYLLTKKGQSFLDRFHEYSKRRYKLEQQSNNINKMLIVLEDMIKENFNRRSSREIRNRNSG